MNKFEIKIYSRENVSLFMITFKVISEMNFAMKIRK